MKKNLLWIILLCTWSWLPLSANDKINQPAFSSNLFSCNCRLCCQLDDNFDVMIENIRTALPSPDELGDSFHYMGFASGGMLRDYEILKHLLFSGHIKKELHISLIDRAYGSDAPPAELIHPQRLELMKHTLEENLREFGLDAVVVHTYAKAPAKTDLGQNVDLLVATGFDVRPLPHEDVSAAEQCLDETTPYLFHLPTRNRGNPFMGRGPTITKISQLLGCWDADLPAARLRRQKAQAAK